MTMSVKLGSETYGEPDRGRNSGSNQAPRIIGGAQEGNFPVLLSVLCLRAGRAVQRSRARELDRVAGAVRSK